MRVSLKLSTSWSDGNNEVPKGIWDLFISLQRMHKRNLEKMLGPSEKIPTLYWARCTFGRVSERSAERLFTQVTLVFSGGECGDNFHQWIDWAGLSLDQSKSPI